MIRIIILAMILSGVSLTGRAGDYKGIIKQISITGLVRTHENVVIRELTLKKGALYEQEKLEDSIRQLKNLRIFTSVRSEIKQHEDGVVITISLIEKWTLIPIARFGGGGGSNFYIIGLYDINTLGLYQETGGQYERLGGRPAGVVWYRNPRLGNRHLLFGLDIWSVNRMRTVYGRDGQVEGYYTLTRQEINAFIETEWTGQHATGAGINWISDRLSHDMLTGDQAAYNRDRQFDIDDSYRMLTAIFYYRLGKLNYNDYIINGIEHELSLKSSLAVLDTAIDRYQWLWQTRGFADLGHYQNIGIQFKWGSTDSLRPEQQWRLGGLEDLRGFPDAGLTGQWFWQINSEYRVSSWHSSWLALQHVLFVDAAKVTDKFSSLLDNGPGPYFSTGTGIRLISPRVYRFIFRLDLARTIGPQGKWDLAFGVQQFF